MPSKLEQEIEEILSRTGGPPPPARFRRPNRIGQTIRGWASSLNAKLAGVNPGQLMLASILIIIGSWFVLRSYDDAMMIVALAGVTLFVIAFVLAILRRRGGGPSPPGTRYWRGQQMDYDDDQGGFRSPFRRR
jgi:hypothetical protein